MEEKIEVCDITLACASVREAKRSTNYNSEEQDPWKAENVLKKRLILRNYWNEFPPKLNVRHS